MRISASLLAVMAASCLGMQAAHAQSADKAQSATAAKTPSAAKSATAQARPAAPAAQVRSSSDAGKARLEGVSTQRSMPADSKKDGGCNHAMASDA